MGMQLNPSELLCEGQDGDQVYNLIKSMKLIYHIKAKRAYIVTLSVLKFFSESSSPFGHARPTL
jgi:hypothetical protein